ncbi:MAG: DUF1116 domain-containing protein [Nitrososphaerota archaeon]|nr:DUF1116 domain-containing protein [Nitrososphaerota archaeon]
MDLRGQVEEANTLTVERMMQADPLWVDMGLASEKLKGMKGRTLLHAGPPIAWERMSGPLRGAVMGACIYEGWASTPEEAERLAASGDVTFEPCHHHGCVGPMAGVVSPRMPVYEVFDEKSGARAFSNLNEGLGKVLRYGAYGDDVQKRLRWLGTTFYEAMKAALRELRKERPGLSFKAIISQALTMGDDCHNRYVAATSLFIREMVPYMFAAGAGGKDVSEVYSFMNGNNFTTLNLGMATAKAMALAGHGVKHSTIVTTMARNGTETGIRVSGLGDRWFTAPAPTVKGMWFPGFSEKDANPDIGDSAITETAGFGGFAMAAAPAIISWVGGSASVAMEITRKMYEITYARHRFFTIPALDFQGTPTGVDIRKVVKTGVTPHINTGVAHRQAGIGQIGAGLVVFPMEMFKLALKGYAEAYGL